MRCRMKTEVVRTAHQGKIQGDDVGLARRLGQRKEMAAELSEAKKIANMVAAFGVRYGPYVWGTGIAMAAALRLPAVLPSNPSALVPSWEPILEFDRTEHPIRDALLEEPIVHRNGVVGVPCAPGLGIEVNRSALAGVAAR
jgi:D-galactarolactone cycloisomerase